MNDLEVIKFKINLYSSEKLSKMNRDIILSKYKMNSDNIVSRFILDLNF